MVEILLAHGADPDVRLARGSFLKHDRGAFAFDKFLIGATPFVVAARRADVAIMRLLGVGGADTSLPLRDGRTAAMVAAGGRTTGLRRLRLAEGHVLETVRTALDLGVDANGASLSGDTVLHVAAGSRFDSVIRLLAERGAHVNARNHLGQTPLTVALAPPEAPDGSAIGGAALGRYREAYAAWLASRGQTPTANLLRALGGDRIAGSGGANGPFRQRAAGVPCCLAHWENCRWPVRKIPRSGHRTPRVASARHESRLASGRHGVCL